MTKHYQTLREIEKAADLRSAIDTGWNTLRDMGAAAGAAGTGLVRGAYRNFVAPAAGAAWTTATAIPKMAWRGTVGTMTAPLRGMAKSDGTLGGAAQGAWDELWNNQAGMYSGLQDDMMSGGRAWNTMGRAFQRTPTPRPQAPASGPQSPAPPAVPTPAAPPVLNPFQLAKDRYKAEHMQQKPNQSIPYKTVSAALRKLAQDLPGYQAGPASAPAQPPPGPQTSPKYPGIQAPGAPVGGQPTDFASEIPALASDLGNAFKSTNIGRMLRGGGEPEQGGPASGGPITIPGGQDGFAKALQHAQDFQPPTASQPPSAGAPTPEQLQMFRRGTASAFDPKSAMDRYKMQQLIAGNQQWVSNPLYHSMGKRASVKELVTNIPRDAFLEFLADAYL